MSLLADLPDLSGFFSYSRRDDEHSQGSLRSLRAWIYRELRRQLGFDFRLWPDTATFPVGMSWEYETRRAISETAFFIPILTPNWVASRHCRMELEAFLDRERTLGRSDLIFPLLYARVPALEREELRRQDPLLDAIGRRQSFDWRIFQDRSFTEGETARGIEQFCRNIVEGLRQPRGWPDPPQAPEEAGATRIAEQARRDQEEGWAQAEARPEIAASEPGPAPAPAAPARGSDLRTGPEPESPTSLLSRRAGATIERFGIPEAKTRPSQSGDVSHSLVEPSPPPPPPSFKRLSPLAANEPSYKTSDEPSYQPSYEPSASSSRSRPSHRLPWLLGAAVLGTAVAAFLYRRDLAALMAPLFKLFGSMVPPMASANPPKSDSGDTDQVELAAFAPPECAPGDTFLVQALLHLPADQPAAYALAVAADPGAVRRGTQALSMALWRGEQLDIDLEAEGCRIDEVRQTAIWRGEPLAVGFFVTVPQAHTRPIPIRITVIRSKVPVGSLRFMVPVRAGAPRQPIEIRGEEAKGFRRAFLSYASEDRVAVLKIAQGYELLGIAIFQDVLSLEPGQRWEKRLYEEIDRADVFVPFWSKAASRSEWVIREIKYAFDRAGSSDNQSPAIRPYLLEGPPIPEIPAGLQSIQFGDKFRYMIMGATLEAEMRRSQRPLQ